MREPAFWYRPPSLRSHMLRPLAAVYGAVAARRLRASGLDAGIPVICVGNYHAGGAGKTPTVRALVGMLRTLDERPVVLSRGYGGRLAGPLVVEPDRHSAADVGDEPLMLASGIQVVVSRDRVDGVALAKSRGASVIVMDDGFQNPAIRKDLSLIVIDGRRGIGNGQVIPAGPLRAPLRPQLARTDGLVVIGDGEAGRALAERFRADGDRPVLAARLVPEPASVAALAGRKVLAFAGIGDPARFFRTLRGAGIDVVAERSFADHHPYAEAEIDDLRAQAARDDLVLVTTEKDLARLRRSGEVSPRARDVVPFGVTLEFDDPARLRRIMLDGIEAARQRRLAKPRT